MRSNARSSLISRNYSPVTRYSSLGNANSSDGSTPLIKLSSRMFYAMLTIVMYDEQQVHNMNPKWKNSPKRKYCSSSKFPTALEI